MEMPVLEALLIENSILDNDTKHADIISKPAEATK
jgi:nitrogenase iron protein NifH